ncbi:unnamed protein product [Schistosoma margrebowiei]|uniref:Uncharacterized protein n=1 Tax=Schistosoma margrebowiei TaxID=48269 RepID=A0AA85AIP5_9TREM|nr:unnamed protein product [Schistosoma margrebowiei]
MNHRIIWIIISISLQLFSLKCIKSEENSNNNNNNKSIEENGDYNDSSPYPVVFNRNSTDDEHYEYELLNEVSNEMKEELRKEFQQFQQILDELTRKLRSIPNSANTYMMNILFMSICIISLNLFIYV